MAAKRKIIKIDEEKCTGCGQCVTACAEGAIAIVDGKAKLVSETYCDGLGACIGDCPEGALTIEERDAEEFDEYAAMKHVAAQKKDNAACAFTCPGTLAQSLDKPDQADDEDDAVVPSQLGNWPVQLHLVPPTAPYLKNADLLLVADCVPFAMGDFHTRFLRKRPLVVGCPKLDDASFYVKKLTDIIQQADIRSLTVIHMEVPCCSGLRMIAEKAVAAAQRPVHMRDVTVSLNGDVKQEKQESSQNHKSIAVNGN